LELQAAHEVHLTFLGQVPLTRAAVEFALDRHAGQRRASDDAAFMVHTLEVASLLDRSSYPDRVLAAAVVHDVIEHADVEHAELEARFGREIAKLVSVVSADPAIEGEEEQRDELRERVRRVGGDALAVYAPTRSRRSANSECCKRAESRRRRLASSSPGIEGRSRCWTARCRAAGWTRLLRFELEALEEFPPGSD
jgi:HD domain